MPAPVFPFPCRGLPELDLSDPALNCLRAEDLAARVDAVRGAAPACWGGWGERRELYTGSGLFAGEEEPRTVHLGVDVWSDAGTPVAAPVAGTVHSLADNAAFGDYGPTVILAHEGFWTLYGHLSRAALAGLVPGRRVAAGEVFAFLGGVHENGGWPPHLHFQRIQDLMGRAGDFPGVCAPSQRDTWLVRCPDPRPLLLGGD